MTMLGVESPLEPSKNAGNGVIQCETANELVAPALSLDVHLDAPTISCKSCTQGVLLSVTSAILSQRRSSCRVIRGED